MQTIITAAEAKEQGTSPAALLSVARFNQTIADRTGSEKHAALAQQVRRVAVELGDLTGLDLRRRSRPRAGNDNRRNAKPFRRHVSATNYRGKVAA